MNGMWHDLTVGGKLPKEGYNNVVWVTVEEWDEEDPTRHTCLAYYVHGVWFEYTRYSDDEFEIIDDIIAWREADMRPYTDDWRKNNE